MKLITEMLSSVSYLEEDVGGAKVPFIEGVFMQSNIRNRNGRVYPRGVLMKEVARYVDAKVKNNTAYGELGHPDGAVINLGNVSHLIVDLKEDGDNVLGKARILPTPSGNILRGIMSAGGRIGVSSRAMGSLVARDDGAMEVQDDLHLATAADAVADPSAPNAYVKGIMEGVEWFYNAELDEWRKELIENHVKEVHRNYKRVDEQAAMRMFKKFLAGL